jgi:hypothetical protein
MIMSDSTTQAELRARAIRSLRRKQDLRMIMTGEREMSDKPGESETTAEPGSASPSWPTYPSDESRQAAIQSLRRKRGFWGHCTVYVIVNGMFVMLWLVLGLTSGAWFFWPIFPMAGWGIGLALNAVSAFGAANRPITEAEIQAEIQQLNRR